MIIGLAGKAGAGKDYIAKHILVPYIEQKQKKSLIISFADQLKINCIMDGYTTYDNVYTRKTAMSRHTLQQYGTERGRDVVSKTIWIDYLNYWTRVLASKNDIDVFIVPDVRFENEVEWIHSQGGVVMRVVSPERTHERMCYESSGTNSNANHVSETQLDTIMLDNVICNDTTISNEELLKLVKPWIDSMFPC